MDSQKATQAVQIVADASKEKGKKRIAKLQEIELKILDEKSMKEVNSLWMLKAEVVDAGSCTIRITIPSAKKPEVVFLRFPSDAICKDWLARLQKASMGAADKVEIVLPELQIPRSALDAKGHIDDATLLRYARLCLGRDTYKWVENNLFLVQTIINNSEKKFNAKELNRTITAPGCSGINLIFID